MLNENYFKKEYTEYANFNRLEVNDRILNKKWKHYKEGTPKESSVDDKLLTSINPRDPINVKISETLEKIKQLRELKKSEGSKFNDKSLLKELSKDLVRMRNEKKNKK